MKIIFKKTMMLKEVHVRHAQEWLGSKKLGRVQGKTDSLGAAIRSPPEGIPSGEAHMNMRLRKPTSISCLR